MIHTTKAFADFLQRHDIDPRSVTLVIRAADYAIAHKVSACIHRGLFPALLPSDILGGGSLLTGRNTLKLNGVRVVVTSLDESAKRYGDAP